MNLASANTRNPFIFVVLFLGLFFIQSYAYQLARGTWLEHELIGELTVKPSAILLNILLPESNVQPVDNKLKSQTISITVLNGCEGTESMFLLIAAILAFSASLKQKIVGVLCGVFFIFVLNQIRIVTLFVALSYSGEWFHWIHAYIGPTLIVVFSCLFFLIWSHVIRNHDATT